MVFCYRCLSRQRKGKRQKDSEREREVKELTQAIISLARLKYVVQASRLDTKVRIGVTGLSLKFTGQGGRLETQAGFGCSVLKWDQGVGCRSENKTSAFGVDDEHVDSSTIG